MLWLSLGVSVKHIHVTLLIPINSINSTSIVIVIITILSDMSYGPVYKPPVNW